MTATVTVTTTAISRSIAGPLTTTFTPPAQCSTLGSYNVDLPEVFFYGQSCNGDVITDAVACYPEAGGETALGRGLFSPGLHCPIGYTSACTAALLSNGSPSSFDGTSFSFKYPLTAGETAVGCCPSGFTCHPPLSTADSYGHLCVRYISSGSLSPVGWCTSEKETAQTEYGSLGQVTFGTPRAQSNGQVLNVGIIYGDLIQLLWQSTDLPPVTISTSTPTLPASQSALPSGQSSQGSSDPLSAGTKVAIGLGTSLGTIFILLLLGAFVFVTRRRKRNQRRINPNSLIHGQEHQELPTKQYHHSDPKELPDTMLQFHEVDGSQLRIAGRSELAADWKR